MIDQHPAARSRSQQINALRKPTELKTINHEISAILNPLSHTITGMNIGSKPHTKECNAEQT